MPKIKIDSFVVLTCEFKHIEKNTVGLVQASNGECAMIYFIGENVTLPIDLKNLDSIDISKTGKGFENKICNICHILKETDKFDVNQTDAKGIKTTRPSCQECRKNIDGVKMLVSEKKRMDKIRPPNHSIFECPVCEKRTIVGITANIVKDHDHDTGLGREWICDSCNTGLGRFKDNIDFLKKCIDYLNKFN